MSNNKKINFLKNSTETTFEKDKELNKLTDIEKKRNYNRIHAKRYREKHKTHYKWLKERNEYLELLLKEMKNSIYDYDIVLTNMCFFVSQMTIDNLIPYSELIKLLDLFDSANKCKFELTIESKKIRFLTAGSALYDGLDIIKKKLNE